MIPKPASSLTFASLRRIAWTDPHLRYRWALLPHDPRRLGRSSNVDSLLHSATGPLTQVTPRPARPAPHCSVCAGDGEREPFDRSDLFGGVGRRVHCSK